MIKGTRYTMDMLLQDPTHTDEYCGGLCLVFRITPADYHRFIVIDDGFIGKTRMIEGRLHSVQPAACEAFPVYKLNRRKWSILNSDHFGPVIQIAVGAVAVGGIVIDPENCFVSRAPSWGILSFAAPPSSCCCRRIGQSSCRSISP